MLSSLRVGVLVALSVLVLPSGCTEADDDEIDSGRSIEAGALLYTDHCAACHGAEGRGDGPIASSLMAVPIDLTRIGARHGGHFPAEAVRRAIDGRSDVVGGRGLQMPHWGAFWDELATAPTDSASSAKIDALVAYLASIQRGDAVVASRGATRVRMAELATALEKALPAVFADAAFADPEKRRRLGEAISLLESGASALEAHAEDESKTFDPLARSLARDAERVRSAFAAGELRRTRFRFGDLLENCVACHARLPDARDSDFGRGLIRGIDRTALTPAEDIRLLLATRQFETARDRYEEILLGDRPGEIDGRGLLVDYLVLCLRVLDDPERAQRTLKRLNIGIPHAAELERWLTSLDALSPPDPSTSSLEHARGLLRMAEGSRRETSPSASLVYDIAASAHLFRYTEGEAASQEELAEAYYLLGLTESRIRRPVGRERWDDYLESAIRLVPGTQTSQASYGLYEEIRLAQYEGVPVLTLPRDELRRLEDLRHLAFGREP